MTTQTKKAFVIDRSKWLRGPIEKIFGDAEESKLRDAEGRKCCLGFYLGACKAKGIGEFDAYSPKDLVHGVPKSARWLLDDAGDDSEVTLRLIRINDDSIIDEKTREQRVASIFSKQGVKVTFKGRTPKAPPRDADE